MGKPASSRPSDLLESHSGLPVEALCHENQAVTSVGLCLQDEGGEGADAGGGGGGRVPLELRGGGKEDKRGVVKRRGGNA